MADHNDPNAVNSIFSDIDVSAADIYDLFGYPSDDTADGEKVVIALTFASVPEAGVFDNDMLYRILIGAHPRVPPSPWHRSAGSALRYLDAVAEKYLGNLNPAEVRVTVDPSNEATVAFTNFRGQSFTQSLATNEVVAVDSPNGHRIKLYLGGRDDAFFNDLPGFFRSINYAPQFYHVPHTMTEARELPIPKTLIELEGNDLFNFDPENPLLGRGEKKPLPPGPWTWEGDSFTRDADGNFRFVYSGEDAQAGRNINAIIMELPVAFITGSPAEDRIVTTWAESWVRKAVGKIPQIGEGPLAFEHPFSALAAALRRDQELRHYKLVDTVGQPFADAALCERKNSRQVGANNFHLGPHFINRLGHLGWGFGPSITALGLETSFDHDNAPVSVHRTYLNPARAFPRVKKTLLQELNMPDDSWRKNGVDVPLRRPLDIFVPNVCAIDMDTTGTWPFGRRPEDQVATRFLSMFLDMEASAGGSKYNVELMGDQALWDTVKITPKTPPNPLRNDKDFLPDFPYLAEPW
jgi:hypothetical protein